jgi:hypothetical protein
VPGSNRCAAVYVLVDPADNLVIDMVRSASIRGLTRGSRRRSAAVLRGCWRTLGHGGGLALGSTLVGGLAQSVRRASHVDPTSGPGAQPALDSAPCVLAGEAAVGSFSVIEQRLIARRTVGQVRSPSRARFPLLAGGIMLSSRHNKGILRIS